MFFLRFLLHKIETTAYLNLARAIAKCPEFPPQFPAMNSLAQTIIVAVSRGFHIGVERGGRTVLRAEETNGGVTDVSSNGSIDWLRRESVSGTKNDAFAVPFIVLLRRYELLSE